MIRLILAVYRHFFPRVVSVYRYDDGIEYTYEDGTVKEVVFERAGL